MDLAPFLVPLLLRLFVLAPLLAVALLDLRAVRFVLLAASLRIDDNFARFLVLLFGVFLNLAVPLLLPVLALVNADLHGPALLVSASPRLVPFAVRVLAFVDRFVMLELFICFALMIPSIAARLALTLTLLDCVAGANLVYIVILESPLEEALLLLNELFEAVDDRLVAAQRLILVMQESAVEIANDADFLKNR